MRDVHTASAQPVNARRKLIRGAFAAPAIMTLSSGSALAATSSPIQCLANRLASPVFPAVTVGIVDGYARVQLAELRPNGMGQSSTFYVLGSTVASLNRSLTYTLRTGQWQVFNVATNTDVGGAVLTTQPSAPGSSATYYAASGRYAVLRFDANGKVAGVGAGPSGTTAVAESCWSSFSAAV